MHHKNNKMNDLFRELLRELPVSINNLADPTILWKSTERKMEALIQDGHTGPIAIITKGNVTTTWWRERLARWSKHLDLYVFVSISELGTSYEKAASDDVRYRNLTVARECGCKAIAYVRPIIHTVNDSPETIERIFRRSVEAGCHAIVSSGFRGDDETVDFAGLGAIEAPDGQHWSKTLKLTPQTTSDFMVALAEELKVLYFTRTMCCVAVLSGMERSLNPYHIAPNFVGCDRCPIKATCHDMAQFIQPKKGSIELLQHLGFNVTVHTAAERYKRCNVEKRQECNLCCTNCPIAPASFGTPYVEMTTWDGQMPSWGEMSFARFVTGGMLCTNPSIQPGEFSEVRLHPRFDEPHGSTGESGLYGVNSWLIWSEYVPQQKCFKCTYCFLRMFEEQLPDELQGTVGCSPVRILQREVCYETTI